MPDVRGQIDQLVRNEMLTSYQAELLLEGRGASLVLGPYRILDWLGAGGMGQVYKAVHVLMKRVVALKIMAAEPPSEEEHQARRQRQSITFPSPFLVPRAAFLREVQAAARLHHPNIVTAFDAAEIDDLLVLVMEYVQGVDLERLVEEHGPLSAALACEYVRQTAIGLQYAHEYGLIHGDVKPSNLIVARGDCSSRATRHASRATIKILDLGLARLAGRPLEDRVHVAAPAPDGWAPPTGLAGTPDYMAPELAHDSRQVSVQSDLYSLGCTFYYLLTGEVPFPADAWTEKLLRHQFDPAPLAARRRDDVPPEIDVLLQRLLAKDPAQRYPDPATLAADLQQWLAARDCASHVEVRSQDDPDSSLDDEGSADTTGSAPELSEALAVLAPTAVAESEAASAWDVGDSVSTVQDLPCAADPAPGKGTGATGALPCAPLEEWQPEPVLPRAREQAMPRRRRWALRLTMALLAAGLGLVAAGLMRWGLTARPVDLASSLVPSRASGPVAASSPLSRPYEVARTGERCATLASAVAAAADGDTVLVHGNGPFRLPPLRLSGKALTLRAGPDSGPLLRGAVAGQEPIGAPLLATDRPLSVEGISLEWDGPTQPTGGSAHLIYGDGAPVRLKNCRLAAPQGSALVVVRQGSPVEITDCRLTAGALALCVEASPGGPTDVRLAGNTVHIENADGAALSVWAGEEARPQAVRLTLDGNRVHADRILALRALTGGVEVTARDNSLTFRQALLSYGGFPRADGWLHATTWNAERNVYEAAGSWLQVEGVPSATRALEEWQALWGRTEPGSISRPPAGAGR